MERTWDEEKNARNFVKHGVVFETALQVFNDPGGIEKENMAHSSITEQRRWRTGKLGNGRLVTVVYPRREQVTRLISAQERRRERREYEEASRKEKS